MSDDVAVVGGSEARADAEQGVEGRCGVAAAVPAEHELVEIAAQMGAAQAMEGSERPALQVREHTMDLDQHEMGGRCTDDLGLVVVLNVPLDPLRLGAWSTRTTHPFYMARWQELLDDLGIGAKLLNPYRFKTKGEMLSECASSSFIAANYDVTVSCSAIAKGRWKKRPPGHCGYCAPCLIRRASIEAAFGKDATAYSIADLHAQALDAQKAESADIRAFQMMHRRLGNNPDLAHVLIYKPGPLDDYPATEVSDYADVFKRGIAEVGALVGTVRIS